MMSRIVSRHWRISTGRHFQNDRYNSQHCPISKFDMWVDNDVLNWFPHWKISTGRHFQNGHHNTTQIQHCSISTPFHMWVDYDVLNWFLTFLPVALFKINIAKIQHCPISSQFDMWVDNDFKNWVPILNNFYWSPFSKWPPQYRKNSILSDIIKIWYVGR